jgi:hypothetical protein
MPRSGHFAELSLRVSMERTRNQRNPRRTALCSQKSRWSAARLVRRLSVAACAALLLAGSARAEDPWEAWPEASAFITMGSITRAYLDASYARGKESPDLTLDATACLDISIQPILRQSFANADWQRSRYLWARIGYTHVSKGTSGDLKTSENRGILSIYWKLPLPAEVWLESRVRADLRWIGGDYSTRYRGRLEATREFTVLDHTVVPYLNAEAFYDSRYSGWSRALYQAGTEVTVNKGFRFEVNVSRQVDFLPEHSALNAVSLVLKWYL